jgi:prepilin-type N-terminal cleavage/methylation domain-containing protein
MRGMPTLQRDSGFTLIELIISIVLIGVLAAVGSSMIADSFTTTRTVNASNASEGQARYVLERLAREIREVKYVDAGAYATTPGYCIDTMTSSKLVFHKRTDSSSVDRSNCTGADTDTVAFDYTAPPNLTLTYASSAASAALTSNVATGGFVLSYLQADGTTVATTNAKVYFVVIALTVTDATSAQGTAERVRVALRNS